MNRYTLKSMVGIILWVSTSTAFAEKSEVPSDPTAAAIHQHLAAHSPLTNSQRRVLESLDPKFFGTEGCEQKLAKGEGPNFTDALLAAQPWIREAAAQAFHQNTPLNTLTMDQLGAMNPQVTINFTVTSSIGLAASRRVGELVRNDLSDATASSLVATQDANITVLKFNYDQSASRSSFSTLLRIGYSNGEVQTFNFESAPINGVTADVALARLIVAAVRHRAILASTGNLDKEIFALQYNILKLLRVAHPEHEVKLTSIAGTLVGVQKRFWERQRTAIARAFVEYLQAKLDLITLSQETMQLVAATTNNSSSATAAPLPQRINVARSSPTRYFGQRYYRPSIPAQITRTSAGSTMATYEWMTDPYFMMTHPLFWGTRDDSLLMPLMMFEEMTDRSRYDNNSNPPLFATQQPYNMDRFNQPVMPGYTADPAQPVFDPWSAPVVGRDQVVTANFDGNGGPTWTDTSGQTLDLAGASSAVSWDQVAGTGGAGGNVWEQPNSGSTAGTGSVDSGNGGATLPTVHPDNSSNGFGAGGSGFVTSPTDSDDSQRVPTIHAS